MKKEFINPTTVHKPDGAYHHAVKVGNTIYTSGQVGLDLNGNLVGKDDLPQQMAQAFENMKHVIEAAGGTMTDIVQFTIFVSDYPKMADIAPVWRKYLSPAFPPCTAVQVARLQNDYMVEMFATAVVDDRQESPPVLR